MIQLSWYVFKDLSFSLWFLSGRNGIFTTKEGLKIAYVSGVDKPEEVSAKKLDFHLDYERVRAMEVRAKCHESNFQGVDILLSTDWPKG